ncbi:MAG: hypothetical protein HY360_17250 [Verrucomicrobia bacterium]|nr:hypothetical protein [Verrucomicrobiota bacterium]
MKIKRFENIEAWPACQGAGRQLARELTRKVFHLKMSTNKPGAQMPMKKVTVNREP